MRRSRKDHDQETVRRVRKAREAGSAKDRWFFFLFLRKLLHKTWNISWLDIRSNISWLVWDNVLSWSVKNPCNQQEHKKHTIVLRRKYFQVQKCTFFSHTTKQILQIFFIKQCVSVNRLNYARICYDLILESPSNNWGNAAQISWIRQWLFNVNKHHFN